MTFNDGLEQALRSPQPLDELRAFAQRLLAAGQDKTAVLDEFDLARLRLREANREREEDIVLEVMDFLSGWCSPHMRLDAPAAPSPADGIP